MKKFENIITKRTLMASSGILLIVAGIFALCNPGEIIGFVPYVLGAFCVISGLCYMFAFLFMRRSLGSGLLLADGLVTVLLGIIMLFNAFLAWKTLAIFLSMALLLIGISFVRFSVEAKNLGIKRWWIVLTVGIVLLVFGLVSLFEPLVVHLAATILAGIILIISGGALLFGGVMVDRNKDKIITVKEKDIEFIPDDAQEKDHGGENG